MPDDDRFLADIEVAEAADQAHAVELAGLLLEAPDQQHLAMRVELLLLREGERAARGFRRSVGGFSGGAGADFAARFFGAAAEAVAAMTSPGSFPRLLFYQAKARPPESEGRRSRSSEDLRNDLDRKSDGRHPCANAWRAYSRCSTRSLGLIQPRSVRACSSSRSGSMRSVDSRSIRCSIAARSDLISVKPRLETARSQPPSSGSPPGRGRRHRPAGQNRRPRRRRRSKASTWAAAMRHLVRTIMGASVARPWFPNGLCGADLVLHGVRQPLDAALDARRPAGGSDAVS